MKKYNIIFLLSIIALLLNSCFSLDQEPYDNARAGNTFNNAKEVRNWLNGIYNTIRDNTQGETMYLTDLQADYLNLTVQSRKPVLRDFQRYGELNSSNLNIARIWNTYYNIIANTNIAIESTSNKEQQEDIRPLRGELYLSRAYCYSYLATHFCKPYNANTAHTDLGLPLVDENSNYQQTPPRSSLAVTYKFILDDIDKAISLLSNQAGRMGANTFTVDAAKALKARMLLYKTDWAQALQVAEELINTHTYPLANSQSELEAIWKDDNPKETITQLFAGISSSGNLERPVGENDLYLFEDKNNVFPFPSFPPMSECGGNRQYLAVPNVVPTGAFVNLFDSADWRKSVYIKQEDLATDMPEYDFVHDVYVCPEEKLAYLVNKYPRSEHLSLENDFFLYYGHKPVLFRIAEIYLIAAEAAYKANDEAKAKNYLNELRHARGLTTANDIATSGAALFTDIQNERNRELCFEGFRLFDLNRWGLGVQRGTPQNLTFNLLVTSPANELTELNLPAGYYKMVWPIPQTLIDLENRRWQQNPNW